jgi:hypothetical protein
LPFDDLEMSNKRFYPFGRSPKKTDCAIVVELWRAMGRKTKFRSQTVGSHGCCRKTGVRFKPQGDIPGVRCDGASVVKM